MARRSRNKPRVVLGKIAGCECVVAGTTVPEKETHTHEDVLAMHAQGYEVDYYPRSPVQVQNCPHAKVYVVEAEHGDYSDYQHWTEAVYWNLADAKAHAERITKTGTEGHFTVYGVLGN